MSTCSNATFSLQQFWRPDFLRRYVDSLPKKDDMTIIYRIHQFINYAKFMKKTLLLFLFAAFLLNAGQAKN